MKPDTPVLRSTRLLDQIRERIRHLHCSLQTEKADLYWARFFIRWHGRNGAMRHPQDMGTAKVEAFFNMLANERQVSSSSTHNQALSALLFMYREVIAVDLPWLNGLNRPAQKRRMPSVLTREEVASLFSFLDGEMALLAQLLYGMGMGMGMGMGKRGPSGTPIACLQRKERLLYAVPCLSGQKQKRPQMRPFSVLRISALSE